MTTYGYIRVSTEEQADGTSLDEQRRQISGNAMSHDLTIDRWIEDAGASGADPFFERIGLHDIMLNPGDTIIVAKLDRFSRDAADALQSIRDLGKRRVRLIINGHGDVMDESNVTGRLMLEIMAVFAGHERRLIKARQKEGQKAKRARGGHIGGSAPFGYRIVGQGKGATLEPIPEQQQALTEIRTMRASGTSLRKIADHVRMSYGFEISHESVRRATAAPEAPGAVF